jgi:NhaA family Na+:H+ antiporter
VYALVGPPRGFITTMHSPTASAQDIPLAQRLTDRALHTLERFLHIEAVSGIVLLLAAAAALIWANSSFSGSYHALWHAPLTFGIGPYIATQSLHFWINDGLMTVFFLVVGMEIRREIHEGALANIRLAALPLAAALGGVVVPALIFLAFNSAPLQRQGWAVPTATDIAFAVGVLALLGRSIPGSVRVLLLALAVIDDLAAVMIIALFYSGGLEYQGFLVFGVGIVLTLGLQRMGIGSAWAYVAPGAVVWAGLLLTGAHPTLAGVVLGLLTPVRPRPMSEPALEMVERTMKRIAALSGREKEQARPERLSELQRDLREPLRELTPPVVRVQMALHPWVAFGVMPLFALANAGVSLEGIDLSAGAAQGVTLGVLAALVLGKPLGVVGGSWLAVRFGWCQLPPGVSWPGVLLVGLLAGIGFTMSIFIANLAFTQPDLLGAAKLGVLLGSVVSAVIGLAWGALCSRWLRSNTPLA